jgi:hypothetical protein
MGKTANREVLYRAREGLYLAGDGLLSSEVGGEDTKSSGLPSLSHTKTTV